MIDLIYIRGFELWPSEYIETFIVIVDLSNYQLCTIQNTNFFSTFFVLSGGPQLSIADLVIHVIIYFFYSTSSRNVQLVIVHVQENFSKIRHDCKFFQFFKRIIF